ncbi:hypothetical protein [Labrys miyagiensis]
MDRMVEAFETLQRIPMRVGPKAFGTVWPQHVQAGDERIGRKVQGVFRRLRSDITEVLESDAYLPDDIGDYLSEIYAYEDARQQAATAGGEQPDRSQIKRMEEALRWPAEFLADMPKAADALTLWAACIASGRSIRAVLRGRHQRARQIAQVMEMERNAQRAAQRRAIAKEVAAWANAKLEEANGDPERVASVKHRARIRFERAIEEAGLIGDMVVSPKEVMPNKVVTQGGIDEWRGRAAQAIADALTRGR